MTRPTSGNTHLGGLSAALSAALAAGLPAADPDDEAAGRIQAWLGRLLLLQGVPFPYLVPDARMLPPESLRIFRLDGNWMAALIDGAFSIGRSSPSQTRKEAGAVAAVADGARAAAGAVRPQLLDAEAAGPDGGGGPITGFLLRSGAVTAWPTMEVKGYADAARQTPLPALRLERLSNGMLIGLFDGVLAALTFAEPAEGLRFGLDVPAPPDVAGATVALKRIADGGVGKPPGGPVEGAPVNAVFRDTQRRVLDAAGTAKALRTALIAGGTLAADAPYTPAEFALEMIRGVQSVVVDIT